jgi:site-specific recombinase XerD
MSHPCCPNPVVWQRLSAGPLGAHLDTCAQQLLDQGYASWTAKYTMRLLADLSCWLQRHDLAATDLHAQRVDAFLQDRYRHGRPHRSDRSILRRLRTQLREHGVIPAPVVVTESGTRDAIAADFQDYLLQPRGLAPTTVRSYLDAVRCFLSDRFDAPPLRLEARCARDITGFLLRQTRRYRPGHAKLIATALRSFFRFLLQRGAIPTDLAKAVPTVPHWRLSALPKFMKVEDVESLLRSGDRSTPQGQRDDAILLLLARLGLRAGEVAALTLDDLDWEAGALRVRGKGGRHDQLPLPHAVGGALVAYLRAGRPPSATRQVFVRLRAPRRGFANGQAVGTIVRRALARAGLNPPLKGAHLLRHSLATQLLHHGASLAEIGELLRHRDLDTTRIDAKVDQGALRARARPWPGGGA